MELSPQARSHLYSCAKTINHLCQPLFEHSPLGFFDYHSHAQKHRAVLSSHPEFTEQSLLQALSFDSHDHHIINQTGNRYFILSANMPLPTGIIQAQAEKFNDMIKQAQQFNIHHRIYFIENCDDGFSIAGFGAITDTPMAITFYFNQQNRLKCFIKYMRAQIYDCIYASKQPLPSRPNDQQHDSSPATTAFTLPPREKNVLITLDNGYINMPKQRFVCLQYFLEGYTAKEISNILSLTHRTVEHHLSRAKIQLKSKHRQTLWHMLHKNGLLHMQTNNE